MSALRAPVRGDGVATSSERGLKVGVQDGFSVWRLDIIGSFLKFQQHGHQRV